MSRWGQNEGYSERATDGQLAFSVPVTVTGVTSTVDNLLLESPISNVVSALDSTSQLRETSSRIQKLRVAATGEF